MQDRVNDYKGMGVQQVWIVDPFRRRAYMANEHGFLEPEADVLIVLGTAIRVELTEMFRALDTRSFRG